MTSRHVPVQWLAMPAAIAAISLAMSMSVHGQRSVAAATFPGSSSTPAFFPDGRRIAFTFTPEKGAPGHLRIANVDGSGERELTFGPETAMDPVVSPDGRFIAYMGALIPSTPPATRTVGTSAPNSGLRCMIVGVDGGEPHEITGGQGLIHGDWSPDSRSVAVAIRIGRGPTAVISSLIVSRDGSERHELASGLPRLDPAAWAPDGRVAYSIVEPAGMAIRISAPDGANPRAVVDGVAFQTRPTWSPDGSRIAFLGSESATGPARLYVVNVDGTGLRPVLADASHVTNVKFSPNGKSLLFTDVRDQNTDIYVIDSDGGHERRLTTDPGYDEHQSWSPDGRQILFMNHTEGSTYGVYLIDANGKNLRRIH